ncbi:hypothetical protein STENM327S_02667 [Streptomyces tendae]
MTGPPCPVARAARRRAAGASPASVDGLADRWGWSREGTGKRIWCELDRCAAGEESPPACGSGGGTVAYEGFAYEVV